MIDIPAFDDSKQDAHSYANQVAKLFCDHTNDRYFTTIGVYPNSDTIRACKVNGVDRDHLAQHILYNITWRPGRALYVNAVLVYAGYNVNSPPQLLHEITTTVVTVDTAPHH